MSDTHYISNKILKINVGFLLSESAGQSRDNEFDIPDALRVADDLTLDYLHGTLKLGRTSRGILVQGTLEAGAHLDCARCLEETPVPIDLSVEELFVYPAAPEEEFVVTEDCNLDLGPLLRAETFLNMPIHVLCRPDCAGLCLECGANLNEGPCDCDKTPIDPRLAALQALKDQLEKPAPAKSVVTAAGDESPHAPPHPKRRR